MAKEIKVRPNDLAEFQGVTEIVKVLVQSIEGTPSYMYSGGRVTLKVTSDSKSYPRGLVFTVDPLHVRPRLRNGESFGASPDGSERAIHSNDCAMLNRGHRGTCVHF